MSVMEKYISPSPFKKPPMNVQIYLGGSIHPTDSFLSPAGFRLEQYLIGEYQLSNFKMRANRDDVSEYLEINGTTEDDTHIYALGRWVKQ